MFDLIFVVATVAFFVLALAYVRGLAPPPKGRPDPQEGKR